MTKFIQITPGFFVAGQLDKEDIARAADLGFHSIIDNRPDGEGEDMTGSLAMEAGAIHHGLGFKYLPVRGFQVTDEENVEAFAAMLDDSSEPVLAYCKSGTRSIMLWAQAAVSSYGVEDVLSRAAAAGYDLEVLRDELEEIMADSRALDAA